MFRAYLSELGKLFSGKAFSGGVVRSVDDDDLCLGSERGADGGREFRYQLDETINYHVFISWTDSNSSQSIFQSLPSCFPPP